MLSFPCDVPETISTICDCPHIYDRSNVMLPLASILNVWVRMILRLTFRDSIPTSGPCSSDGPSERIPGFFKIIGVLLYVWIGLSLVVQPAEFSDFTS